MSVTLQDPEKKAHCEIINNVILLTTDGLDLLNSRSKQKSYILERFGSFQLAQIRRVCQSKVESSLGSVKAS